MIAAFDSYYYSDKSKTVGIIFNSFGNSEILQVFIKESNSPAAYEPGSFYKRELPGIIHVLDEMKAFMIDFIIIDGFVWLDDNFTRGLGAHLYFALKERIPVIGIAKSNFATVHRAKRLVYRGNSNRPLFISAVGIDLDEAAEAVRTMPGNFRIPDILKQLDLLSRS